MICNNMKLGQKIKVNDNQIKPKKSFGYKVGMGIIRLLYKLFKIKRHGIFYINVVRKDGTQEFIGAFPNLIVNAGLAVVSGLVGNVGSEVAFTYLAVGSDNTAAAATQTALQAEISINGLSRAAATVTQETTTVTDDTLQLYKEFSATGSSTVQEVGIFNDGSAGSMLARAVVTSTSVVNGDKLQVTYKIPFSDDGA